MIDLIDTRVAIRREPLPIGELAPDFALMTADDAPTRITRQQFRGKAGLLLIFITDADPAIMSHLSEIAAEVDHIKKLNVRPFVIVPSTAIAHELANLPFPVLIDQDGQTWQAYSAYDPDCCYGMFLLDRYGGVDSELITDHAAGLPNAATTLDWARFAMYKCVC